MCSPSSRTCKLPKERTAATKYSRDKKYIITLLCNYQYTAVIFENKNVKKCTFHSLKLSLLDKYHSFIIQNIGNLYFELLLIEILAKIKIDQKNQSFVGGNRGKKYNVFLPSRPACFGKVPKNELSCSHTSQVILKKYLVDKCIPSYYATS